MLSKFFIDRPVFATVISVVIVIVGLVSLFRLPIAQYPEIVPPTVQVTTVYPGANAKTVSETVATPIEQEINGVEGMLYMSSKCTNDGAMSLDVTFRLGTNLDFAQVLVQNRVSIAQAKLPEEVRRQGVITKKRSPDILLVVNLVSPDNSRDSIYVSNYATLQVKDALARVQGVGDISLFGARDYSMRVWLDPERLAARSLEPTDIVSALSEQNIQVAAGRLGQAPAPAGTDFQLALSTKGRLLTEQEFGEIIIKTGADGQVVRLKEVARVQLGAKSYDVSNQLDGNTSVGLVVYQLPGANALETAQSVKKEMERLKRNFPEGLEYRIVYDTTVFVEESIAAVYHTLFEAFLLVFLVVLLFLQDWKATILPMIDVPVSLIGTFAVMAALGFTLNNLTLFGLVLAIGIVVDDAIVILENVERWLARGLPAREATIKAMEEVTGPVIAITLVLASVFIPTAFITGISGEFYRQFALTIAASTIISAINAMTMTPSRAAQIFKHEHGATEHKKESLPWWGVGLAAGVLTTWFGYESLQPLLGLPAGGHGGGGGHDGHGAEVALGWGTRNIAGLGVPEGWQPLAGQALVFLLAGIPGLIFQRPIRAVIDVGLQKFNAVFDWAGRAYGQSVKSVVRLSAVMVVVYLGLMVATGAGFRTVPGGFIPEQDKGYVILFAQLPDGAALERTERLMEQVQEIALKTPGVIHTINVPGFSLLTGSNLSNCGTMFVTLAPFSERKHDRRLSAFGILAELRRRVSVLDEAAILALNAPPVNGLGNSSGFKMQVQARGGQGADALQAAVDELADAARVQPGLVGVFSTFRSSEPQLYLDVDRTKVRAAGIRLESVFRTISGYLGTAYVNDFTLFNRNWQVNVQAESNARASVDDIRRLKVRNGQGQMAPLGAVLDVKDIAGPSVVTRYNLYPAADLNGSVLPGTSSGRALEVMEQLAANRLPQNMDFEWTELSLQQRSTGNTAAFVFVLGTIFVYLVLAAQYESWTLPAAVILIVPMCLFAAIGGLWLTRSDNNIFTQIGLVVLIGLASKNAILIVEFARQLQDEGRSALDAVSEACALRLRPILMTSLAFILGVVPLVLSTGAGAEMRRAIGLAVFSGMLGVTLFGLFFTPVFFYLLRRNIKPATPHAGPSEVVTKSSPDAAVSTQSTPDSNHPAPPTGTT